MATDIGVVSVGGVSVAVRSHGGEHREVSSCFPHLRQSLLNQIEASRRDVELSLSRDFELPGSRFRSNEAVLARIMTA